MTYTKQYSFPNVNVYETIKGPQQFTSDWRNVIGIAAPFNKGPLLGTITSRQDLVTLYGEDNSIGSTAIRQAMLQGATNFIVSRALPSAKGASGSISFSNPDGSVYTEPLIGATDNRTVGLTVDFSFISEPFTTDSNSKAYAISATGNGKYVVSQTNTDSAVTLANYEGLGSLFLSKHATLDQTNYDFFLRTTEESDPDAVGYESTTDLVATGFDAIAGSDIAIPLDELGDPITGVQVIKITFPKASITKDNYIQAFQPGMRILGAATGAVLAAPGVIVSELLNEDDLNYAFYAKVEVTSAGDGSFKLALPAGTEEFPTIDIYKVYYRTSENEYLPGDVLYFGGQGTAQQLLNSPISYLVLNRHDDPGVAKSLVYYTIDSVTDAITEVATTITYKVGDSSDTYIKVLADNQTINFAKTSVEVGETNTLATDFPNTTLAFAKNKSVLEVLTELKRAIIDNPVLARLNLDVILNQTLLPYSLSFVLGIEGEVGNNIKYKVSRVSTGVGTADIVYEDNGDSLFGSNVNFVGGVNAVTPASRMFYDRGGNKVLYVEALSPGLSGNNVLVNIIPVDQSNFRLEVREEAATGGISLPNESFFLSNTAVDLASGVYPETLSSKLIRAYYVPVIDATGTGSTSVNFNLVPLRLAPEDIQSPLSDVSFPTHPSHVGAQYLQNIALIGGSEPVVNSVNIPEESYIDAIERLENQDVAFITAPGLIAGDIRYEKAINALILQADQATPYNGLRLAILAAPPKLTSSRAELLNSQYSSPNLIIVGGWSTLTTSRGIGLTQYSSEGYYVGLLATTDTYISPSSSYNNKYIQGATNLDTDSRLSMLDAYTNNNIEMLHVDRVSGKVKFLNGRTTSGNLNYRWVAIKRQTQHLIMNIVRNLDWARSAPNAEDTRQRVASAVDALLKSEQRRGAIAGYRPTIINNNDTARQALGYMDLIIVWTPVTPADYINVQMIRTISTSLTIEIG